MELEKMETEVPDKNEKETAALTIERRPPIPTILSCSRFSWKLSDALLRGESYSLPGKILAAND